VGRTNLLPILALIVCHGAAEDIILYEIGAEAERGQPDGGVTRGREGEGEGERLELGAAQEKKGRLKPSAKSPPFLAYTSAANGKSDESTRRREQRPKTPPMSTAP